MVHIAFCTISALFGAAWLGLARPGLVEFGTAQRGSTYLAQCDSQLGLTWLGVAQSATASAGKGTLGPYGPVVVNPYFGFDFSTIFAKPVQD